MLLEKAENINSYALALDRCYRLRDAWTKLGSLATSVGSTGQLVAHPLLAAIESAERHLAAADKALTARRGTSVGNRTGNRFGQHSAPDRAAVVTTIRRPA